MAIGKIIGKAVRKASKKKKKTAPPKVTKTQKKPSPKRQRDIDAEERLTERQVREPARRQENIEAGGTLRKLQRAKDVMVGGNKRKSQELAPKKTAKEAGASAKRIGTDLTLQQSRRLQSSYDGKKAQVAWLKANDPKSSRIADLTKEMKELEKRTVIDKSKTVKPKRPPGSQTPAQVRSAGLASAKKELIEVTQKLNTVGNQKLIANMRKQGKKVPRLTTDQIAKLKERKAYLQKQVDKLSKGVQKKAYGGMAKKKMAKGGYANCGASSPATQGSSKKLAMGGMLKKPDNPGLKKLPSAVRNKMGYMAKGGYAKKK